MYMICQLFGNCGLKISQPDPGATLCIPQPLCLPCHRDSSSWWCLPFGNTVLPPPDVIITAVFSEGLMLPEEAAVTGTSAVPQGRWNYNSTGTRAEFLASCSWREHIMSRGLRNAGVLPLMGRKLDLEKRLRSQERFSAERQIRCCRLDLSALLRGYAGGLFCF